MTDISLRYLLFGEDRSASAAIGKPAAAAKKTGAIISGTFSKLGSSIGGPIGEAVDHVSSLMEGLGGHSGTLGEKMAGTGVAVAGLGAGLSILGSKEKEAENALDAAIKASGHSTDQYGKQIEETVKQQENYGNSASTTKQALATLTLATKDPAKAIANMGLVANLAAAQHISLQSASSLVGKALTGSTRVFKQYGIHVLSVSSATSALHKAQDNAMLATQASTAAHKQLANVQHQIAIGALTGKNATDALATAQANVTSVDGKAKTAHDQLTKAQHNMKAATDSTKAGFDELSKKLDGQAAASVDSFSGHLHVLETKAHDFVSMVGEKFGPALQAGGVALAAVGTVTQILANRQLMAAAATEAETAATTEQTVATDVAATSTGLLGAAMDALPIFALIAGLALLVAGFVYAYKHSATFRAIVQGALHAVGAAADWLGGLFVKLWHVTTSAFGAIIGAVSSAFSWVKSHWPLLLAILTGPIGLAVLFIVQHWKQITDAVSAALGWIRSHVAGMWDGVTHAFSTATGAVKSAWGTFLGWAGGLGSSIGNKVAGMFSGITAAFRSAINALIDIWNQLHFTIPSIHAFGHTIGGGTVSVPQIPHLAAGGALLRAGSVMVGEHGREQLTLPAGATVRPLSAREKAGGGAPDGDLGTFALDLRLDGKTMQTVLLRLKRTNGGLALGLA